MLHTGWYTWTEQHPCLAQWVAKDLSKWRLQLHLEQRDECLSCVCMLLCVLWWRPKGDRVDSLPFLTCHNYLSTLAFTLLLLFTASSLLIPTGLSVSYGLSDAELPFLFHCRVKNCIMPCRRCSRKGKASLWLCFIFKLNLLGAEEVIKIDSFTLSSVKTEVKLYIFTAGCSRSDTQNSLSSGPVCVCASLLAGPCTAGLKKKEKASAWLRLSAVLNETRHLDCR